MSEQFDDTESVHEPEESEAFVPDDSVLVESGDTWESVAARCGADVADLLGANVDLGRPSSRPPLVVGQRLRVP